MKTPFLLLARRLVAPVTRNQLLALGVLLPLAAAAETVPCPLKKVGQWYRFAVTDLYNKASEQLVRVDAVEGDRLFIDQSGKKLVTDPMHNWYKFGGRAATPKYYTQIECPFTLGETRVYKDVDYDGDPARKPSRGWSGESKARGTMTVTVAPAFESMSVKAGSFKVVKIVSDNVYQAKFSALSDQRFGGWNSAVRVVSYYAPEVGMWVKSESTEKIESDRFLDRFELLEYKLGE